MVSIGLGNMPGSRGLPSSIGKTSSNYRCCYETLDKIISKIFLVKSSSSSDGLSRRVNNILRVNFACCVLGDLFGAELYPHCQGVCLFIAIRCAIVNVDRLVGRHPQTIVNELKLESAKLICS